LDAAKFLRDLAERPEVAVEEAVVAGIEPPSEPYLAAPMPEIPRNLTDQQEAQIEQWWRESGNAARAPNPTYAQVLEVMWTVDNTAFRQVLGLPLVDIPTDIGPAAVAGGLPDSAFGPFYSPGGVAPPAAPAGRGPFDAVIPPPNAVVPPPVVSPAAAAGTETSTQGFREPVPPTAQAESIGAALSGVRMPENPGAPPPPPVSPPSPGRIPTDALAQALASAGSPAAKARILSQLLGR